MWAFVYNARIMLRKVTATDDTVQIYQCRDLDSSVIAHVPQGHQIQLGTAEVFEGREWVEAILEDGTVGYILGPTARGHTTFGVTLSLAKPPDGASASDTVSPHPSGAPLGELQDNAPVSDTVSPLQTAQERPVRPMPRWAEWAILVVGIIAIPIIVNVFGPLPSISSIPSIPWRLILRYGGTTIGVIMCSGGVFTKRKDLIGMGALAIAGAQFFARE